MVTFDHLESCSSVLYFDQCQSLCCQTDNQGSHVQGQLSQLKRDTRRVKLSVFVLSSICPSFPESDFLFFRPLQAVSYLGSLLLSFPMHGATTS